MIMLYDMVNFKMCLITQSLLKADILSPGNRIENLKLKRDLMCQYWLEVGESHIESSLWVWSPPDSQQENGDLRPRATKKWILLRTMNLEVDSSTQYLHVRD